MSSTLPICSARPVAILELPLAPNAKILRPEQVIAKIGAHYHDLGSLCYAVRSSGKRKSGQPRGVKLTSFLPQRPKQILQLIRWLSAMLADSGNRVWTVKGMVTYAKLFVDWADETGHHDCLAGDTATRTAFRAWVTQVENRYRTHELNSPSAARLQSSVCVLLEGVTSSCDLARGVRFVRKGRSPNGGTQPAAEHNFAHSLALNQALFDELSELVLEVRPFPFKLNMPKSLGWDECHLWAFPSERWQMPPRLHGQAREELARPYWIFNYAQGRVATVDELWHRYQPQGSQVTGRYRWEARRQIERTHKSMYSANIDPRHRHRIKLAMIAHNAFVFLFLANTGCNLSVAQEIETGGTIDASTLNQRYRSIKYRAQGKEVQIVCPAAFMPSMRRFMELRNFLLNGLDYPYLFFTLGNKFVANRTPSQMQDQVLVVQYETLRRIDVDLTRIPPRTIRATVEDYYRREIDSTVAAHIMGHSEGVAESNYRAGSPVHHHEELSLFLSKVSASAKSQKIIVTSSTDPYGKRLEEGGTCDAFGQPEAMAATLPLPNCFQGGCLFCYKRVLVADEDDARKVASAAFVMEQLILGPLSEGQLRSQIQKCDDDLEKIAKFEGCHVMVERVRKDVYENGNLTPYFENKYQLFLELGVL